MSDTADRILRELGPEPVPLPAILQLGISRKRLRTAVANGHVMRVRHGIYSVDPRHGDLGRRIRAALQAHPAAVLSHGAAAHLHGLPCPWAGGWSEVIVNAPHHGREHPGVRRIHRELRPDEITEVDGLPVTTIWRTAMDVATSVAVPLGLAVADAAVRTLATSRAATLDPQVREEGREHLRYCARRLRSHRGVARARVVAELADGAAESVPESVARGHMWQFGFAEPVAGRPVTGRSGNQYFGDLVLPEQQLIIEIDGRMKYYDTAVLVAEKRREDDLRSAGWRFVRVMPAALSNGAVDFYLQLLSFGLDAPGGGRSATARGRYSGYRSLQGPLW